MVLLPASVAPTGCESVRGVGGGRRRVRGTGRTLKVVNGIMTVVMLISFFTVQPYA